MRKVTAAVLAVTCLLAGHVISRTMERAPEWVTKPASASVLQVANATYTDQQAYPLSETRDWRLTCDDEYRYFFDKSLGDVVDEGRACNHWEVVRID